MLIYPAIDLRGGRCVRLQQGDYNKETIFGSDPAAMARRWVDQGASYLHLVDLDGARQGQPINCQAIRSILEAVSVPCQLGGGLRQESDVAEVLNWGVARAIVGTRAVEDAAGFEKICQRFPGRVVLGLDARDGKLATEGWLHTSDCSAIELARQFSGWPLAAIVYTDISRDGMLTGPNLQALAELAAETTVPIIASGGVTSLADVGRLADLSIAGCIIGRALYEGRIDLAAAIARASKCRMESAD